MVGFGAWRKIPQWIAGVVFVGAVSAVLIVGGLAALSSPETAKPILAGIFREALLHTDATQDFEQLKPYLQTLPPEKPLAVPGLPDLGVSNGEAAGLDSEGLVRLISSKTAEKAYEGQLRLPPEAGVDTATIGPLGAVFSADAHLSLTNLNTALWLLAGFMGAIMVLFSRRFGRLAAPGLALVVGSALPAAVYSFFIAQLERLRLAGVPEEPGIPVQLLEPVISTLKESQRPAFSVLFVGAALIVAAVVGGLAARARPGGP